MASGREDVDVQMLGRGRPFALEITGAENTAPSASLLCSITANVAKRSEGKVTVNDLQVVYKKDVTQNLKNERDEKRKKYTAVCCCSRELRDQEMNDLNRSFKPLIIQQKTPIRVLHRRPLAVRSRSLFELELHPHPSGGNFFSLTLVTESGTYIKEFVHSDFGRTSPSLRDIIGNCITDILSLDVEEVFVEWPPPVSSCESE